MSNTYVEFLFLNEKQETETNAKVKSIMDTFDEVNGGTYVTGNSEFHYDAVAMRVFKADEKPTDVFYC